MLSSTARQLVHQLDLLCKAGIDFAAVTREMAVLVRQLVGADAAAVFWLNAQGMPEGFYHEDSPPEVQALFLDEFERLFVGPDEVNVFALAQHRGRRVGNLIVPPDGYFTSNTFNLLIRPSGHHHTLDMRVEVDGRVRAVVLLFRGRGAFGDAEAKQLGELTSYFQRALSHCTQTDRDHELMQEGFLLLDAHGHRVLLHSPEALAILSQVNLAGTGAFKRQALEVTPPFSQQLCAQLKAQDGPSAHLEHAVPSGRMQVRATRMHTAAAPLGGADGLQVLVEIKLLKPRRLEMWRRLLDVPLSPTQREIALLAGMGLPRSDCIRRVGVSKEALKKHLKVVYSALGASDWDELHHLLMPPCAGHLGASATLRAHHPSTSHR